MFKFKTNKEPSELEKAITATCDKLEKATPGSPGHTELIKQLEALTKLKSVKKDRFVAPDTVAIIAGNLLGIVLILGYEHKNVITSKALGFVTKSKL